MMTKQKAFNTLSAVAIAALMGLSSGANALCLNANGSLDDSSMETAAIDRGMLPACEAEKPAPAKSPEPQTVKTEEPTAKPAPDAPKAVKKAKHTDRTASVQGDCRTANGESRDGSLGAVDMLPACAE